MVGRLAIPICILLILIIPFGCRKKTVSIPVPKPDPEALRLAAEGDAGLREGHLYGWRKAESSYKKALELTGSDEFKRKLLLSCFLVMTRQIDEDIPSPHADEITQELCSGEESRKSLCEIILWYRDNKRGKPPDIQEVSIFNGEQPELERYFKLLLGDVKQPLDFSSQPPAEGLAQADSPLLLYLSPWKLKSRDPAEVETAYPGFAEALEYIAESNFQKKKYGASRTYHRKALDLIPDYTRAINGLANIYFFALEDYDQALRWYESALKQDPSNIAAQFGKGAALHKLDRYHESNAALDRMLSDDSLKNGRLDQNQYRYYCGEGNYLKAFNYKLMDDPAKARELIDLALQFLPYSEEINEFSGLLYFNAHRLEEARKNFERALARQNANCSAQMYMGLIYSRMEDAAGTPSPDAQREKRELSYFLGASSCMETAIKSLKEQIESVPSFDLEPREKILLSDRMKSRLLDFRVASSSNIEKMIESASQTSVASKETYLKLMREMLGRLR